MTMLKTAFEPLAAPRSAKRDAILAAAVELFLEVGYGAASINLLVERVGGSKSTVYAHFENKEKLFEAVIGKVIGEVTASLHGVEVAGLDLRRGLELIGKHLHGLVMSERHIGLVRLVVAEARRFPEIGRIYYRYGPGLAYKGLEEFLGQQAGSGHIGIEDPEQAAEFFAGMLLHRGTFRRLCVDGEPPGKARAAKTVADAVDRFIRAYT